MYEQHGWTCVSELTLDDITSAAAQLDFASNQDMRSLHPEIVAALVRQRQGDAAITDDLIDHLKANEWRVGKV